MKSLLTVVALGASLFLGSCSAEASAASKQESLMQQSLDLMNELADEFDKMTDADTAKAAVAKIEQLADELIKVAEQGEKLGEPSQELVDKFKAKAEAAGQRMGAAMMKIMTNPEAAGAMEALTEKLQKIGEAFGKK